MLWHDCMLLLDSAGLGSQGREKFHSASRRISRNFDNFRRLSMIFDDIRRPSTTFDDFRRLSTTFDDFRRFLATFDDLRRLSTTCDDLRRLSTAFDDFRRLSTIFDNFRRHSATFSSMPRCCSLLSLADPGCSNECLLIGIRCRPLPILPFAVPHSRCPWMRPPLTSQSCCPSLSLAFPWCPWLALAAPCCPLPSLAAPLRSPLASQCSRAAPFSTNPQIPEAGRLKI